MAKPGPKSENLTAAQKKEIASRFKGKTQEPGGLSRNSDEYRDQELWNTQAPDNKTEANFLGNLSLRFLRGISPAQIKKLSALDRVRGSKILKEQQDLCLNRPPAQIDFNRRREIIDALPRIQAEMERRRRERMTIDITPGG